MVRRATSDNRRSERDTSGRFHRSNSLMAATMGKPFSHSRIISMNNSGGSCKSAATDPTASPCSLQKAHAFLSGQAPKLRAFTITLTLGSSAAMSRSTSTVPSFDALSTKRCSKRYSGKLRRHREHPPMEFTHIELFVVAGSHDGDHFPGHSTPLLWETLIGFLGISGQANE